MYLQIVIHWSNWRRYWVVGWRHKGGGDYTVLVKPKFADKLKLRRMPLRDKVTVSLAVDSGEVKKFEFDEYVHLKVYSVDHSWESKTIRATVAPGLCTNLILGLSFLASH